jgi:PAS domain S-box-containing protein
VLIADAQQRIVHVEGGAFESHGLRTRGWIGLSIDQVLPAEAHATLIPRYRAAIAGESQSFEYWTQDGQGAYWVQMAPVRNRDGEVTSVVAVMEDITQRLRMTAELARSEARLREAERMVGVGSWEVEVLTGEITFSAGLARLLGLDDAGRLDPQSHLELVHPEDRELVAFVLHSQPIVDLVTGQTVQNELLLRMRAEDGSIIAPGEFLPVAERYGLISEIDRWVVRQAVELAAGGTPTEFNLSGRSIPDPNIMRELATAIQDTGVDPSLLVVEVTETAFVGQTEAGREFAQRVRALGCGLALDDFGTGFSSLSYLKHLPADYLKIDIDFVRDLTSSETDARVIRGIVGLAREFHQTTIAEGVEDEATLMMLKELGVDQAQGYLFGKPAPQSGAPAGSGAARHPIPAGCAPTAESASCAGCAPTAGSADPIEVVRGAFEAFAARDQRCSASAAPTSCCGHS